MQIMILFICANIKKPAVNICISIYIRNKKNIQEIRLKTSKFTRKLRCIHFSALVNWTKTLMPNSFLPTD